MKGGMFLRRFFLLFFSFYIFLIPAAYCSELYVNPGGKAIGVKMHTDGLIVVDVCKIEDINGIKCCLDQFSIGDIIISANEEKIENTDSLKNIINKSLNNINFTIKRRGSLKKVSAKPIITENGPALGLWLRDSTAGVGTLTYYEPDSKTFGALGHGICDIDTSVIMPINSGSIIDATITNVIKSNNGAIGELECDFKHQPIGKLTLNTPFGIFGKTQENICNSKKIPVASVDEIHEGDAKILVELDNNGIKEYQIQIKKINKNDINGKNMVLQITDPILLEKTGGIVQGMSGSPVIQNGKLVGAVTHVFVNDPTRGYGIFIENMLAEAEKIK